MPSLKIVPDPYNNTDALDNVINYIFRKASTIGGMSVDPAYAADNMKLVKKIWFQEYGRQLRHFVLCFSEVESAALCDSFLIELAYMICDYYRREYQIVFGIHKSSKKHIHFVVNSVNYLTGEKFPTQKQYDYALVRYIKTLLSCSNLDVYYI